MVEYPVILVLKIIELIITLTCVGLHDHSFNYDKSISTLVTGTFIGFSIILTGLVLGFIIDTPVPKYVDIFYTIVGIILFTASGAVLIHYHRNKTFGMTTDYRDKNLAKGSLAIINAGVMVVDLIFQFQRDDDD